MKNFMSAAGPKYKSDDDENYYCPQTAAA